MKAVQTRCPQKALVVSRRAMGVSSRRHRLPPASAGKSEGTPATTSELVWVQQVVGRVGGKLFKIALRRNVTKPTSHINVDNLDVLIRGDSPSCSLTFWASPTDNA